MLFIVVALLFVVGLVITYKVFVPVGSPDMELTGVMTEEELLAKMVDLAVNMNSAKSETSFSSQLIRQTIEKTYKRISKNVGRKKCLEFENWIYDNYYKLAEIIFEQKRFTHAYNKLPGYKNLPRIFCIAELMVKGSGGSVTAQTVKKCIDTVNEILPLDFNEIEMLPAAINLALLEYVAIFCSRSKVINEKFDKAKKDIGYGKIDLSLIKYNSYAYAFVKYADGELLRKFDGYCASNGLSAYKKADNFLAACLRYTGGVSSAIKSIYSLAPFLTDEFVLSLSTLNSYLAHCNGITYEKCTTDTKFVYLRRIAKKSKRKSEIAYAGEITRKAISEGKDIAHYVLQRPLGKFAFFVYFLVIVGYTISNCVTVHMFAPEFRLAAAIIFFPISLNLVLAFVTSINVRIFHRRYMPHVRIDDDAKTMIVFPVLVFDEKEVDEMVDNLLTVSYANTEEVFSYGLLLDLPASDRDVYSENDEKIIFRAEQRMRELGDKFNLFIRKRVKAKGEEKFQGWEKKRGAILELNNLILTGDKSSFEVVLGSSYSVKYVITLDSDTMINCGYELVEIMEHPYNSSKAVVGINVKSAPSSLRTPFAQIMTDSIGLNSYSNFIADANYDIFGSGNYTGKGIYRVKEFTAKVGSVFMENRVLSHDFVEGAIAGCGNSGESAIDSYPETFSSYLGRNVRWLRGDYQLLPFLFRRIKDKKGRRIKNPLSLVARLHILNNILLGLIPLSSVALLALSLFSTKPFLLTGIAFALNLFVLLGSLRLIFHKPKRIGVELVRQLLMAACLPTVAYNYAKAIVVTLYRLAIKKNLLDWKVFAHSGGKVSFLPNFVAVAIYIFFAVSRFSWTYVIMALLFALGVVLANVFSKRVSGKKAISLKAESMLKKIAADTWIYFEKQLKEDNNYLPFDNYQEEGGVGYAPRTSPTDIAFMITSLVCAHKMGFVEEKDFAHYANKILTAIEKADKWKGNLYNWLDVFSLKRLNGYVSSVDSGNLLASLILLRNSSCGELAERANELIAQTDLGAFFDEERGLLRIGYDDYSKSYDSNHYDMLGSESMLTYLVGIGTGKLKSSCFKNLSGRCVKFKGVSLYSWTGGAFEYMMSAIFFKYQRGGLLYNSAKAVLKANVKYAKNRNLPFWGVSESQYSAFDESGNYQYKAFGVPHISLSNEKRKAVASPYSSILFLPLFPDEVSANVIAMYENGLKGEDGLYEAYDGEVIKTYMAHHQGMILASICNYFYDDAVTKLVASPDMRAASLLITVSDMPRATRKREYGLLPSANLPIEQVKEFSPPMVKLMTGGKYSVLIDSLGNGYSYYDGKFVSRHYNHSGGLKLFLNEDGIRTDIQKYASYFFDGRAEFVFNNGKCEIKQTVCVLPSFNGEVRSVRVKNLTDGTVNVDLESYMEVALAPLYQDLAHKTFSGMFVTTSFDEDLNAVTARRGNLILAHYFDVDATYQSNRGNFFGRTRGEDFGRVLDPIVSGKARLSLKQNEEKVFEIYTLVCEDYERLKRQVRLTLRAGFFEKAVSQCATVSKGYGISSSMQKVASKLLFDSAPNLIDGEFPLVLIQSNTVTERIKNKIKMLSRLSLWGISVKIVFAYYGDGFTKERILESVQPILGKNCIFMLVNKDTQRVEAQLAEKSATNIDEIDFKEIRSNSQEVTKPYPGANLPQISYAYQLGKGGFIQDASYALEINKGDLPPRPWSNIIANKNFGTLITESGGGYTYFDNSRENKLTEWSNDPIADECAEGVVMFEGVISWSCALQPVFADADYQTIHSFGYTEFRSNYNGFLSRLREFINGNTKYYELTLTSTMDFDRSVEVLFFVAPVLGDFTFKTSRNLTADFDGNLTVKNLNNGKSFVMGSNEKITYYYKYKQSYTDKRGVVFNPQEDNGYEFKPAIKVSLQVPPLGSKKAIFYLSADGRVDLTDSERVIAKANKYYSSLSSVSVCTGNPNIDYLAKWLPYQFMTSRFFGKTGFYQAGGAIGFRDQLQDCLGVLYVNPKLVKSHILNCAAHQFEAGDVQHWWHEPRTGVRTKISDDRLFLPFITAEYIEFTGDEGILNERIPYLEDVKILGKDYYGTPDQTLKTGTLLEHCLKALKVSARLGENGLVLMGGGDWNDAMDEVGINGKGTTVWGSMFLYMVVDKFLPHIKNKKPYYALMDKLKKAIDNAWDGEWYVRAYCDDGTVLGSKKSKECHIDLITQSFAAISKCADSSKAKLALLSAANKLVDSKSGIIKLLTPPLKEIKAGYICDYPPGVRENGGQYTHGAIWYIMSLFEIGEWDYAYSLLNMISPINHSKTAEEVDRYEVEPYVISADVYSEPAGKGGWSWYTGAAAWCYHVIVKYLFGITINGDNVTVSPKMPKSLLDAKFSIKKDGFAFDVVIDNRGEGEWRFNVDGRGYNTNTLKLTQNLRDKEIVLRKYK